jgi:anion-transporting  ArsA/GET3 family ATPase
VLLELVKTGPLAEEARDMRDLLWDEQRTLVHLVSLAEELPVEETIGLAKATRESLKMPLGSLFINRVWPPLASDAVRKKMESFRSSADGDEALALRCFDQLEARRRAQEPHLKRLREALELPTLTLPEMFGGATGLDALSQIGQMMEAAWRPPSKERT